MIKVSRNKGEYFIAAIFLLVLICCFFQPVLFGGKTLFPVMPGIVMPEGSNEEEIRTNIDPTAFVLIEIPNTVAAASMIKDGTLPLWNPYVGCGIPMSANLMTGLYNPLKSFLLLFQNTKLFDLYLMLKLFLAGFFTYLFLRKIHLSKMSSLLSATAFMFSGYFMCYLTLWHVNTDILIPLLLLLFEYNVTNNTAKNIVYAGIGVGLVLLAGSPQCALLIISFASIFYFYRIFSLYGIKIRAKIVIKKSTVLAIIIAIGLALSACMLIDFQQFYESGMHQVNLTFGQRGAALNNYSPLSLVSFLFSPLQFLGTPLFNQSLDLGRLASIFIFPYMGIITVILAVMAIGKDRRINRLAIFFLLFSGILIINLLGGGVWLSRQSGGLLSFFNHLFWAKYLGPLYFSFAILAGLGFENLRNKKVSPLWITPFLLAITGFVCFCCYKNPALFASKFELKDIPALMPTKFLLPFKYALSIRAGFIALGFISITVLLYRLRPVFIFFGILVLLFMELYVYYQPRYPAEFEPYAKAKYVDFLSHQEEEGKPFRVCGGITPQINSVYELEDVNNIDAIFIKRYYDFMINLITGTDRNFGVFSIFPQNSEQIKSRYYDLLNVKYFITTHSLYPLKNDFVDQNGKHIIWKEFLYKPFSKPFILLHPKRDQFSVLFSSPEETHKEENRLDPENRVLKPGVLSSNHNPGDAAFCSYTVPQKGARLYFTIGTDPEQWSARGDGVEFVVKAKYDSNTVVLFEKYIDPKHNKSHRRWFNEEADLTPYSGKQLQLIFTVHAGPKGNTDNDNCGFADIEIKKNDDSESKLSLVYNDEVKIYRNNTVMPRAFVVHQAETVPQREELIARLKKNDFDFRNKILFETTLPEDIVKIKSSLSAEPSTATILSYKPDRVDLEAVMNRAGFLVLTDTYYPGWKAYVDDCEVEIYPADIMFRSVYLTEGRHTVRFVYRPGKLLIGAGISLLTVIGLFLFLLLRKRS